MVQEGAYAHTLGNFYRAVVQAALIFVSETWVMYPLIGGTLGGFLHWVIRQLTGWHPRRQVDGSWVYPPLVEAMAEAYLEGVEMYDARRNTFSHSIYTRTIMYMCLEEYRIPGLNVYQRWC